MTGNGSIEDAFVSVESLMACLHCSRLTVYRRCRSGALPFVKVGRRLLFRKSDIEAWFARNTHGGSGA